MTAAQFVCESEAAVPLNDRQSGGRVHVKRPGRLRVFSADAGAFFRAPFGLDVKEEQLRGLVFISQQQAAFRAFLKPKRSRALGLTVAGT